jgi:hypothetical protein
MRKLWLSLPIVLLFVVPTGCCLFGGGVPAFDEKTVAALDATIAYENAQYEVLMKELTSISAPEAIKANIQVRHDSEIGRLVAWRLMESAKKGSE